MASRFSNERGRGGEAIRSSESTELSSLRHTYPEIPWETHTVPVHMKNGHVRDRFFTRDRGGGGENPRKRMKKTDEEDRKIWRLKKLQLDVHICRHTKTYMQKMQFFTFSFRIRIMIDLLEARKISTSFRTSLPLKNSENHHDFFYHHHPSYYPSYHPSYHHFRTKTNMHLPIVDSGKYHWITQEQR